MPGSIKVGGAQRSIAVPQIKVAGAWRPATIAYIKVGGSWRIWHSSDVSDNFNRVNSTVLGIASNGFSQWTTQRGTWEISSNRASSSTAGTSYALATTPLYKTSTDITLKVDMPDGTGTGVAFWVVDANNWWAVQNWENVTTTTSGGYYYCTNGATPNGGICESYCSSCVTSSTSLVSTGCRTASQCAALDPPADVWEANCSSCFCSSSATYGICYRAVTTYGCTSGSYNSTLGTCDTSVFALYEPVTSTTTTTRRVRLIRAEAGSVSVVQSQDLTDRARSLEVTTSGNNVTVKTYSGGLQTGLLNTLTYTSSGATKTTLVGILKGQTDTNQGSAVDNFSAV